MAGFLAVDVTCPKCDSPAVITDEAFIVNPLKQLLPGALVFAGRCRCSLSLTLISVDPARLEMALRAGSGASRPATWRGNQS